MNISEKLTQIAANEQAVYEAGRKAEHEACINPEWKNWDSFSIKNNRNSAVANLKYGDTSNGTSFGHMFNLCSELESVPAIDTGNGTYFKRMFAECSNLVTIGELNLSNNGRPLEETFYGCASLQNITFAGPATLLWDLDIGSSPLLSKDSITGAFGILSKNVVGTTLTLSQTAVENAFDDDEWAELIATKSNWNISLV